MIAGPLQKKLSAEMNYRDTVKGYWLLSDRYTVFSRMCFMIAGPLQKKLSAEMNYRDTVKASSSDALT